MHPRSPKKKVGSHKLDVDVAMGAAGFFLGADNTTLKVTFGSNFCTGPQNCVFQIRSRSDRKSTRLNSSHSQISYAVFCLKKKRKMRGPTDCQTPISHSVSCSPTCPSI